jgi:hypothetical protein
MGRSVEFLPDWSDPLNPCGDARWLFGGEEREVNDYDNVVIFLDDLEKCTATDLQAAMRRARRFCEHVYDPVVVAVTEKTSTTRNTAHGGHSLRAARKPPNVLARVGL